MKPYEARVTAAQHAMQSGVAMELQHDPSSGSPKHLRVGVNTALVDTAALAKLLIAKGLITENEYLGALAAGMEEEVERYKVTLKTWFPNVDITLG